MHLANCGVQMLEMHSAGTTRASADAGCTYARVEDAAVAAAAATTAGRAAAARDGAVFAIERQFTSARAHQIIVLPLLPLHTFTLSERIHPHQDLVSHTCSAVMMVL